VTEPDLSVRILHTIKMMVPFVFFMAFVYLVLHIVFARLIARPDSPVLWFFSVVTGPLTRPVRGWLAPGAPERRVRLLALGLYFVLWQGSKLLLGHWIGPPGR
jgi:hypothetical protein